MMSILEPISSITVEKEKEAIDSKDTSPTKPNSSSPSSSCCFESRSSPTHIAINLVPPLNFSLVEDGIYRSGFPMPINYPFLQQLNLKTIIYLGDLGHHQNLRVDKKKKVKKDKDGTMEILNQYIQWIENQNTIKFHNLLVESSREPFNKLEEYEQTLASLTLALQLILNKSNYPILIHSNKGKHRTGLLVGLMRKLLQGWCLSGIFEEYERFAMGKFEYDLELIEIWQPELLVDNDQKPNFVRI
ncbi:hypothetical protein KGF56_002693 [Candida oxycetoniae]|uniref:Uncharacterized protein n=1 Tax=Candida oxycetoniae TaxID=497107 RepID=A0AAI9WY60_9ASCO|nr:uncharacterized protein KGF56_002693 [Candida oxycetoniae]KAI3404501.2 hypothetical protein KGF56_002693 [Candida oxycetoniae]